MYGSVLIWIETPVSAVEISSSFRVTCSLFVASLINTLLVLSVSFGGWPSLGRFVVVPYSVMLDFNGAPWDCQSFRYYFVTQT